MADTDAEFKQKIRTLIKKLRTLQAQTYELAEEMERLLDTNPTTGDLVRRLFEAWKVSWGGRYPGDQYAFAGAKDATNFKRLLKTFPPEEIERRMHAYLGDGDPFYTKGRHPLGLFVASINKHGTAQAAPDLELSAPTIPGCRHVPRCTSDQTHTKRTQADIRGETQPF